MVKVGRFGAGKRVSKSVEFGGRKIDYVLERRKVRNARLHFSAGRFLVVIPDRLKDGSEVDFLREKRKWILKKYAMLENVSSIVNSDMRENRMPILGDHYQIAPSEKFSFDKGSKMLNMDFQNRRHVGKLGKILKNILCEEIDRVLKKYSGLTGGKKFTLSVRKQRTRWASCSPYDGRMSFNLRMAFIPKDLVEYIIFHELTHDKEIHHNSKFYKIISDRFPNFKDYEKELNKHWLLSYMYLKNFFLVKN